MLNMGLFTSSTGPPCPRCQGMIMVSGVYFDKDEPELGVTKCGYCKTELQVSTDPVTGKTRAEEIRRD